MKPTCRICHSAEHRLVSDVVSDAPQSAVYRCGGCDLVYLYPIMGEEAEAAFYREQFEKYMEGRSGSGWKSPDVHFATYQGEAERRLPLVLPYLNRADDILEIGSSTGYFLNHLQGQVGSTTGIEPSESYRAYAVSKGINTVAALGDLGDRHFDVILLFYVLEHLRDPVGFLHNLEAHLRPGGRVILEVPNVDDALLSVYAVPAFGPFYWQRAHYQNFSHRTVVSVLERAGYHASALPVQRYDLSNHMVWMRDGLPGGHGRFKGVLTAAVEEAYADALKASWACDTVFAVATRRAGGQC